MSFNYHLQERAWKERSELLTKLNSLDERICGIIGDTEVNACYVYSTPARTGREIEIYPVKGSIQEIHFWRRSGGSHPVIEYAGPEGMQVYPNGQVTTSYMSHVNNYIFS